MTHVPDELKGMTRGTHYLDPPLVRPALQPQALRIVTALRSGPLTPHQLAVLLNIPEGNVRGEVALAQRCGYVVLALERALVLLWSPGEPRRVCPRCGAGIRRTSTAPACDPCMGEVGGRLDT